MILEDMTIKRKTWVAAFILLVILAMSGLDNTDTMVREQTGDSVLTVTEQKGESLNLMELKGEDLRKAELWLADLNKTFLLSSIDKTDGENGNIATK